MAVHESECRSGPGIRAALLQPPKRRSLDVVRLGVVCLFGGLYLGYVLAADFTSPLWWSSVLIVVAALAWAWAEVLPARVERFAGPVRVLGHALFVAALAGGVTVAIIQTW